MVTVTAAQFNQNPSQAKRAAGDGPVVITERSRPAFVLMSYAEYERLSGVPADLSTWLQADDDIDFEIPEVGLDLRGADL